MKEKENNFKMLPPGNKTNWSKWEDRKLLSELYKRIKVVARNHGRTPGAVILRLLFLNKKGYWR